MGFQVMNLNLRVKMNKNKMLFELNLKKKQEKISEIPKKTKKGITKSIKM